MPSARIEAGKFGQSNESLNFFCPKFFCQQIHPLPHLCSSSLLQPTSQRLFQFLVALDVVGLTRRDGDPATGAVLKMQQHRGGAGMVGEGQLDFYQVALAVAGRPQHQL